MGNSTTSAQSGTSQKATFPVETFEEAVEVNRQNNDPAIKIKDRTFLVLHVSFWNPKLRKDTFPDPILNDDSENTSFARKSNLDGAWVITTFDRFADIFVDRLAYEELKNIAGLKRVEISRRNFVIPESPISVPVSEHVKWLKNTMPNTVPIFLRNTDIRPNYSIPTGKNVTVAIIDSGLDFRHPAFIDYDDSGTPTSRIRYLWDPSSSDHQVYRNEDFVAHRSPFLYPGGQKIPIGSVYTNDDLTQELRYSKNNSTAENPSNRIKETLDDKGRHGTRTAQMIAGRNGKLDPGNIFFEGLAPDVDLIVVRLIGTRSKPFLLNAAIEWIDSVRDKNKPLIVNGSIQDMSMSWNGQSLPELQLNARFNPDIPGRALILAAGNAGSSKGHTAIEFNKLESPEIVWALPPDSTDVCGDDTRMFVYSSSPFKIIADKAIVHNADGPIEFNNESNEYSQVLSVENCGRLRIQGLEDNNAVADFYFMYYMDVGTSLNIFENPKPVENGLITFPGATENALTVGSYDWTDDPIGYTSQKVNKKCEGDVRLGRPSCLSGVGPVRSGAMKPDLVAPGQFFSLCEVPHTNPAKPIQCFSKIHNATSAATPYFSGIAALLMEKRPDLTTVQLRGLLKRTLTRPSSASFDLDGFSPAWGYGLLDQSAFDRLLNPK